MLKIGMRRNKENKRIKGKRVRVREEQEKRRRIVYRRVQSSGSKAQHENKAAERQKKKKKEFKRNSALVAERSVAEKRVYRHRECR